MAFRLTDDGLAMTRWPHNGWRVRPSRSGWNFENDRAEIVIRVARMGTVSSGWGIMLVDEMMMQTYTRSGLVIGQPTGPVVHQHLIELMVAAQWAPDRIEEWR